MKNKVDTKSKITTAIILDTPHPKKNGLYPIKLRLTFQRKQKYYNLKLDLSNEDFEKTIAPRPRGKYKEQKHYFEIFENRAIEIIEKLDFFSFDIFEDKFYNKSVVKNDVFNYYDNYIIELKNTSKLGNAEIYQMSKNSIKKFIERDSLNFKEITVKFLNDFENYMLEIGNSITTVGIRLRCLRKLYNDYLEDNELPKTKQYPFGKNKYQIPQGKNKKRALNLDAIEKIFEYVPEPKTNEQLAKDIFIFSYLSNGINISDILRLKFKNIENNEISFIREKTKNMTKSDQITVSFFLTDPIKAIIECWQNEDRSPDNYIFPQLKNGNTEIQNRDIIKNTTKTVNKHLKRIATKLELNINLTTYVARHSFATVLKNKGITMEYISESLGHNSLKTTKNYLDSFEDETKKENSEKLYDFKK